MPPFCHGRSGNVPGIVRNIVVPAQLLYLQHQFFSSPAVVSSEPLIHNAKFGTNPVLVHASGRMEHLPLWPSLLEASKTWRTWSSVDPRLSIVTFNNGRGESSAGKRLGLFEESLRASDIEDFTVLGGAADEWRNAMKIRLLLDFLDSGRARDYVLMADSADVLLCNDLSSVVPAFQSFGCGALFNGERRHWPSFIPPFEEETAPAEYFQFLNSGVWIAEAAFARELTAYCVDLKVEKYAKSDQLRYKIAYRHFFPAVRIDHRCTLFQNINCVDSDVVRVAGAAAI